MVMVIEILSLSLRELEEKRRNSDGKEGSRQMKGREVMVRALVINIGL